MKKALYRAFRPQTFDEVLGQDQITKVLKNQVKTKHPGHAYLFAGSRGTGKTSSAKIFARAINCLHPVDGNPCNACANCKAILNETTMDVVEMDAASNRRIDDIRELRDNVLYPPAQLKYKVYIIDEAHMITTEAFNALLKIMEEPPAHLIFILATTDPQEIPATVLSRTQRYEFRRLDLTSIKKNLTEIGKKLDVTIEPAALHALALAADGSMRDGLSLLDQLLASGTKNVREEEVKALLGTVGYESVARMTRMIFTGEQKGALAFSEDLLLQGKDPHLFLKELIDYFRLLLLVKALGKDNASLPVDEVQKKAMEELADLSSMERLCDSMELLIDAELLMRKADFGEAILQSALVRLMDPVSRKNWISRLEAVEAKLSKVQVQGLEKEAEKGKTAERSKVKTEQKTQTLRKENADPPKEKGKNPASQALQKEDPPKDPLPKIDLPPLEEEAEKEVGDFSAWFLDQRAELAKEAEERAIFPAAFFEKIQAAERRGETLLLFFTQDQKGRMVLPLVKAHEEELSLLFEEKLHKKVHVCAMALEEGPKKKNPYPAGGGKDQGKRSKEDARTDPEEKIREVFPAELLDLVP